MKSGTGNIIQLCFIITPFYLMFITNESDAISEDTVCL